MAHLNRWRICPDPPGDNPAYADEGAPTPDEEEISCLVAKIRVLDTRLRDQASVIADLTSARTAREADLHAVERERDAWHRVAVQRQ